MLFIGNYNKIANVDAAVWLCQEIMPIVWQQMPTIKVTLLGSEPPPKVKNLANALVTVTGYLENVRSYFLSHRVFVAPLKYSSVMSGKIGQSLKYGLPIVSTSLGTQAMNLKAVRDVLVADTASDFAGQILHLYQNEILWNQLAANGERAIASYHPESVKADLVALLLPFL